MQFSYATLRNFEQKERNTPHLTDVGADFYKKAMNYIRELEEKAEEERKKAKSKKLILIEDELRNTKRVLESIFERREKKILLAALSAVRGGKRTISNLTREEKIFYESLIEILKENRKRIFESGKDYVVVRILEDIPQFMGADMKKYNLSREDVISLPVEIANIIIGRGAGEEVKMEMV